MRFRSTPFLCRLRATKTLIRCRTLRGQRLQSLARCEEPCALECRLGGVILGPTGREGLAILGHRERVDGDAPEQVVVAPRRNQGPCGQLQADGDQPTAEAGAERTRPSVDRLRRVCYDTGFPGVGTS